MNRINTTEVTGVMCSFYRSGDCGVDWKPCVIPCRQLQLKIAERFPNLKQSMKWMAQKRCPECGKKLKKCKDSITGKISDYIYRCDCWPKGIQMDIG